MCPNIANPKPQNGLIFFSVCQNISMHCSWPTWHGCKSCYFNQRSIVHLRYEQITKTLRISQGFALFLKTYLFFLNLGPVIFTDYSFCLWLYGELIPHNNFTVHLWKRYLWCCLHSIPVGFQYENFQVRACEKNIAESLGLASWWSLERKVWNVCFLLQHHLRSIDIWTKLLILKVLVATIDALGHFETG